MPAHSDSLTEYRAVREKAGFFNFNSLAKLKISGKDRISFLNGLTTNDMARLSDQQGLYTLLPTLKGKIASEAIVCCFSDHLLLLLLPSLREKTLSLLNRYKIGTKSGIEDVTGGLGVISLQGPEAFPFAEKLTGKEVSPLPEFGSVQAAVGEAPVTLIRHGWSGEDGLDFVFSEEYFLSLWDRFLRDGAGPGILPAGEETKEQLRLEAGLPLYGKELSEEVLPQEAGLDARAISYTKGCYLGQETIARLHYQGHTNRSLVGLLLDRELPEGAVEIFSGEKQAGRVTSHGYSPGRKQAVALGYVQRQFIQPGTSLEIHAGEKRIAATVATLPMVPGTKRREVTTP